MQKTRQAVRRARSSGLSGASQTGDGSQGVHAAIEFETTAGSLEHAIAALGAIENIGLALNESGRF